MTKEEIENAELLFAKTFFNEVSKAVSSNEHEVLCMLLPGITLSKEDYEYDYIKGVKSPTVEANESKLANKLFDPYTLAGSDNGYTLPNQYLSALNMLTPKLNPVIAKAKNELRKLLIKRYPFTFEMPDGTSEYREDCTFQEVYFHLYSDYLETAKKWAQKQTEKKREYADDPTGYLVWYQDNAEVELNIINQKRAKILAIFSPNDMKILEGVLDSGSGAELQEARQLLNNLKKLNPDGSYTYPVKFYPSNWFESLDKSFTPVDLLKSTDKLVEDLKLCYARRNSIESKIEHIASNTPSLSDVESAAAAARKAEKDCDEKFNELVDAGEESFFSFISSTVKSICSICDTGSGKKASDISNKVVTESSGLDKAAKITAAVCEEIISGAKEINAKQNAFVNALSDCVKALESESQKKNKRQLHDTIDMLKDQLKKVNEEIKSLSSDLALAASRSTEDGVQPPDVPDGFTQVIITHKNSEASSYKYEETTITRKSTTAGALFFKKKTTSTTQDSKFTELCTASDTKIEIGMNVAKVAIEREWFNPGVFRLTSNMYNLAGEGVHISLGPEGFKEENVSSMADCVFPCYPTAMLIARDVTIKITNESSFSSSDLRDTYSQWGSSSSFVFYNSGSGGSKSSSESSCSSYYDGRTITMKFASPQAIGFYLEAVPYDASDVYPRTFDDDAAKDIKTITQFVETYKEILDTCIELNKK